MLLKHLQTVLRYSEFPSQRLKWCLSYSLLIIAVALCNLQFITRAQNPQDDEIVRVENGFGCAQRDGDEQFGQLCAWA